MNENQEGLYSIGGLSKIVGISADALRYYDDIGLVKPKLISTQTSYRYYSDEQAVLITRIGELKQYGFSLNEIKGILANADATLSEVYQDRYMALLGERRRLDEAIEKLSQKIIQIQEGKAMKKNILIADDAKVMRLLWKDMLENEGFKVAGEACDGDEAIELYEKIKPDLFLTDLSMPNTDGLKALRKIKESDETAKAVMCSAYGLASIVIESLLAGAGYFVIKPFRNDTLLNSVRTVIGEDRRYNRDSLVRLNSSLSRDKPSNLRQAEIDELIRLALKSELTDSEIEAFTQRVWYFEATDKEALPKNDESELLARISKLERGQEEIKEMLKKLVDLG